MLLLVGFCLLSPAQLYSTIGTEGSKDTLLHYEFFLQGNKDKQTKQQIQNVRSMGAYT